MTGHLKRFTASATGEGFGETTLYARILEKVTLRNRPRGARSFCTLARSITPSLSCYAPSDDRCAHASFAPRWYVPRDDIGQSGLTPVDGQTFCPYEGL